MKIKTAENRVTRYPQTKKKKNKKKIIVGFSR